MRGLLAKLPAAPAVATRAALYAPDERSHASLARALRLAAGPAPGPAVRTARQHRRGLRAHAAGRGARAGAARRAPDRRELRRRRRGARAASSPARSRSSSPAAASPGTSRAGARCAATSTTCARAASASASTRRRATRASPRPSTFASATRISRFKGQRCRGCGAVQFPIQRVCETCFRKDDFELLRLSDRDGPRRHLHPRLLLPDPRAADDRDHHARSRARGSTSSSSTPGPSRCIPASPSSSCFRRIHEVGRPAQLLLEGDAASGRRRLMAESLRDKVAIVGVGLLPVRRELGPVAVGHDRRRRLRGVRGRRHRRSAAPDRRGLHRLGLLAEGPARVQRRAQALEAGHAGVELLRHRHRCLPLRRVLDRRGRLRHGAGGGLRQAEGSRRLGPLGDDEPGARPAADAGRAGSRSAPPPTSRSTAPGARIWPGSRSRTTRTARSRRSPSSSARSRSRKRSARA